MSGKENRDKIDRKLQKQRRKEKRKQAIKFWRGMYKFITLKWTDI